jgi:hypothetical protein
VLKGVKNRKIEKVVNHLGHFMKLVVPHYAIESLRGDSDQATGVSTPHSCCPRGVIDQTELSKILAWMLVCYMPIKYISCHVTHRF